MGRVVTEIRLVDLKRSNVDWKKSDPEHGKYVFVGAPVYVDYNSDKAPLPDHKVQWANKQPDNIDLWKYRYDSELVRWQDKLYWPEGIEPNAEGWYQYQDVVLMMCPAHLYVERKKKEHEKSQRAAGIKSADFKERARQDGVIVYEQGETEEMRKHLAR